jgi:hypothetical protein
LNKTIFNILIFIISFNHYYSQQLKNNLEAGALGNLGFLHIGYTRSLINFSEFSLNTGLKIGYVPSPSDEYSGNNENNPPVPNFIHLNLPVELLWKFHQSNNVGIGASYSKILLGSNEYNARTKSNYNRILGEISYSHILDWSNDSETTTWIKVSFTPIIYDDHANDVSNIPVRLAFVYNF